MTKDDSRYCFHQLHRWLCHLGRKQEGRSSRVAASRRNQRFVVLLMSRISGATGCCRVAAIWYNSTDTV
ncbi:hypothetical protein LSAT2_030386, partial [Lamellibrachia satsuma]